MEHFEKLEELSNPLIEYLHNNFNPHTSIIIDWDRLRVISDEISMPIPIDKKEVK